MSTSPNRKRRAALIGLAGMFAASVAVVAPRAVSAGSETYDYTFNFANGITLSGTSSDKVTFLPDAGGSSVDDPRGMDVHLSCSDDFPGGYGEKDGPVRGVDTAWQIDSYSIAKIKKGKVDKTCGNADLGNGDPIPSGKGNMYSFTFVNGVTIDGMSSDNVAFLANAGGSSVDNPSGMEVHVSCSDDFPGGFGEKDGPVAGVDTAWQIASYSIKKVKDGKIDKQCGDSFGPPAPIGVPSIDLEKTVNGADADSPTGPRVQVGDTVTFAYTVTNDGEIPLTDVAVVDETFGAVSCPKTALAVNESMSCDENTKVVTEAGQQGMDSNVTAIGNVRAPGIDDVNPGSGKGYVYSFTFVNGTTLAGVSDDKTSFLANAGGSSADNPTGMEVHLSCSDEFPGGWGEKDGPVQGVDTAWQIASFEIGKVKDGSVEKKCGTAPGSVPTPVSDSDPVFFIADPVPSNPSIDIEKSINGQDADSAPGPSFDIGDQLVFRYVVTNTGDTLLSNIDVTDSILGDIGCTVPNLGPGGSYGCPAVRKVATTAGPVLMEGTVTGDAPDGQTVTDTDPVNFVVNADPVPTDPSIDIEKSINGQDADSAPGPSFDIGDQLVFRYVVTNTGDTLLSNIDVTDSILGDIGCTVPNLGPGGSYGCPAVRKVATTAGPVLMEGTVTGDAPDGQTVTDTDPVNFVVNADPVPTDPSIDIEKSVNGQDADSAPGPQVEIGQELVFRYVVTNTGNTVLTDITVSDSILGDIGCTVPNLGPGGSYGCPSVRKTATTEGPVVMIGSVIGIAPGGVAVTDSDPVNFDVLPGGTGA